MSDKTPFPAAAWPTIGAMLWVVSTAVAAQPRVLDERYELELVASEPDIVTPIGITFDDRGRMLVIESHTHFPPDDYSGPSSDRIRYVEDTDGDGRADRFRSFLEGTEKTMSLRRGPDDWIYIATRMRIFRARDTDGDDQADEQQPLVDLNTAGDYPHNGLCGLCFDGEGNFYFGLGENLGESYEIVGTDGTRLSGGGEGGNIYRCRFDGSGLEQIATGFWNPFGICTDTAGRVFTVGNDPDASPPCRLVHVVRGGDYGFQFRYGRSGKHPLQAWDGELPGTLPMVAGTSEAPSSVVLYNGQLVVSSWGEYRVERFTLEPRGASVTARRDVIVQGDESFRPVDFGVAPDGSLVFTDWVDRSYNVHGKGRIWRLRERKPAHTQHPQIPPLSPQEWHARHIYQRLDWSALESPDPFIRHAAVMALADHAGALTADSLLRIEDPRHRLGILIAARKQRPGKANRDAILQAALGEPDPDVRLVAVRWIADEQIASFKPQLQRLLDDPQTPAALLKATLAAIDWLDSGKVDSGPAGEELLIAALEEPDRPRLLQLALKLLPDDHPALSPERLAVVIANRNLELVIRREAARSLAISPLPTAPAVRQAVVTDATIPVKLKSEILAGLPPDNAASREILEQLADSTATVLSTEARRILARKAAQSDPQTRSSLPAPSDTDAWLELVASPGDPDAGWHVFFGRHGVRCGNCHKLDGRGADVGPDLTGIASRVDQRRVLQSILEPSREISPRYVPWTIETDSGQLLTGLSLGVDNHSPEERFLAADGTLFSINRNQISGRHLGEKSIMPDGLERLLSVDDLRHLLALLRQ